MWFLLHIVTLVSPDQDYRLWWETCPATWLATSFTDRDLPTETANPSIHCISVLTQASVNKEAPGGSSSPSPEMPLLIFQPGGRLPPQPWLRQLLCFDAIVVIFSFPVISLHPDETGKARYLAGSCLTTHSFSQWPELWHDSMFCQMGAVVVNTKNETRCSPFQLLHIHAGAWMKRL